MDAPPLAHLPDIPHAGYSTRREKELSDALMFAIRGLERDRLMLLSVVLDGRAKWRSVAKKAWRALRVDDEAVDAMFSYLELLACRPAVQRELLKYQRSPGIWRRIMRSTMPDLEQQREALRAMQRRT